MKRAEHIFVCLLIGLSAAVGRQADVRGVVSDSSSGERIPYANVVVVGLNKGAAANTSGYFIIPNLLPGSYEISASAVGYVKKTETVTVGSGPVALNFRLSEEAVKLGEVVVSGEMKPELLAIQSSVHVIDKMELERVPVGAQADILRSIQILPGIVTTSDVNSQFYVRGGAGDQNLFLLDGMRIYNPFHAFGLFSTFDPDIVRTTEVYTGAFPAEFGNRLSAVVNMISRDGNAQRFSGLANLNFLSSKLQLEGPLGESVQAIFTGRKSLFENTFKTYLKQKVPLSFYDAFLKLSVKRPDAPDRYSAQVFVTHDYLSSNNETDPAYAWDTKAFAVKGDFLMSDRLFWDLTLSVSNYESVRIQTGALPSSSSSISEFGLRGNITSYTDTKDVYFFGFDLDFPATEYVFLDRLGDRTRLSETLLLTSIWVRYQFKGEIVNGDFGVRGELGNFLRWGTLESLVEPRVSVSFNLQDQWIAKAAVGRFTQGLITVTNEDDILPIFTPWIVVPLSLRPEIANHYVLGLDGPLSSGLSVSLQTFYKQYPSIVTYNRDKLEVSDPDYINSTGRSYGGEALLRFASPFVDAYAAYTASRVIINQHGFEYAPRYDRRHTLNLLTVFHPFSSLDVSLRWEFGSGLPYTKSIGFYEKLTLGEGYPNSYMWETADPITVFGPKNAARLPAYHRLDAGLTLRLLQLSWLKSTVGVNISNLYDQKNIFYFDRKTGQRYTMIRFFPSAMFTLEFQP